MKQGTIELMAAVTKALGRDLDSGCFEDRLLVQKGCFILNRWGYTPMYTYDLAVRGPYSRELTEDYEAAGTVDAATPTSVSDEDVFRLREIMGNGPGYLEAYATLLAIDGYNPGISRSRMLELALSAKPELDTEIRAAFEALNL